MVPVAVGGGPSLCQRQPGGGVWWDLLEKEGGEGLQQERCGPGLRAREQPVLLLSPLAGGPLCSVCLQPSKTKPGRGRPWREALTGSWSGVPLPSVAAGGLGCF